jgi:hypothetical protein
MRRGLALALFAAGYASLAALELTFAAGPALIAFGGASALIGRGVKVS